MSFTFFVMTLAFGNLIGAFGSLFAGLTDRSAGPTWWSSGCCSPAVFVAFILPAATSKWVFTIEGFVVGVVEGICLVATPALIRDFSPQVGRATAMGFWTSGPVLGSLIVAVVGTRDHPGRRERPRFWTHEYRICGYRGHRRVRRRPDRGCEELSPQAARPADGHDAGPGADRGPGQGHRHRVGAEEPVPSAASRPTSSSRLSRSRSCC